MPRTLRPQPNSTLTFDMELVNIGRAAHYTLSAPGHWRSYQVQA